MAKNSAGLIMYRIRNGIIEVLLVHPGGPFWARKDTGAWSIVKGEIEEKEDALTAARREFAEETGIDPGGPFSELGSIRQKGGKTVQAWCFEGNFNPRDLKSNTFEMEWPPHSGHKACFPENDRAEFYSLDEAREKINPGQIPLLKELDRLLSR